MATVHRNLTGADLHEPKGADTATSGKVYVSDGAGSGSWTDASSIITNTAFTTGDLKITHKTTADTSWIMWAEGTIGDGSSSATIRANADTADLFAVYWAFAAADCPIYTSSGVLSTRGASAAADFAAHKRLSLPAGNARSLMIAGAGSGLTTRTLGSTAGAETFTLATANLPPYTPSGTVATTVTMNSNAAVAIIASAAGANPFGGSAGSANSTAAITATAVSTFTGTPQGGTTTAINKVSPVAFVNVMIKL
jgi:microcystin-dependent protein